MKRLLCIASLLYSITTFAQIEQNFTDPSYTFKQTYFRSLTSLKSYIKKANIKATHKTTHDYTEVRYGGYILFYNYYSNLLDFFTFETATSIKGVVQFYEKLGYSVESVNQYGLYYMVHPNGYAISVERGSKSNTTAVSLQNNNYD